MLPTMGSTGKVFSAVFPQECRKLSVAFLLDAEMARVVKKMLCPDRSCAAMPKRAHRDASA